MAGPVSGERYQAVNDAVLVAASAGGLSALTSVLSELPADFSASVAIVQHIEPHHRSMLAEILGRSCALPVVQADDGQPFQSGVVHVAPPDHHLLVNADGSLSLTRTELVHFVRPSADLLFESGAASFGIVREANRAAAEPLAIDSRFLIGKPLATFVDADDRADLRALVNAFGSAAQVDDWSVRLVRRTGAPIMVSLSASAARDGRNELVGIRWIVRDMSARDRSERALLALADKRRGILDAAPEGIFRLDRDGSVDYANPAAARLLGRSEAELRGRQLIDMFVEGQTDDRVDGDNRVRRERAFGGLRPGSGQWEYTEPAGQRAISLNYMLASLVESGRVVGSVVSLFDITDRRELERDLRRRADRDALTGLHNRSAFERELERELGLASRYRTLCAMLLLDVDSLKVVNDVHGHLAGDALLRAVAMALRKRLRQTDIAGRLGGDEFGVLLPQADETAARTVASEILAATRAHEIAPGAGATASVSVGIALVKIPGLRTTDVFRCADEAMYRGKNTGGDRIVVVDATLR